MLLGGLRYRPDADKPRQRRRVRSSRQGGPGRPVADSEQRNHLLEYGRRSREEVHGRSHYMREEGQGEFRQKTAWKGERLIKKLPKYFF